MIARPPRDHRPDRAEEALPAEDHRRDGADPTIVAVVPVEASAGAGDPVAEALWRDAALAEAGAGCVVVAPCDLRAPDLARRLDALAAPSTSKVTATKPSHTIRPRTGH